MADIGGWIERLIASDSTGCCVLCGPMCYITDVFLGVHLCIWRFDSYILRTLERVIYDVMGRCPKAYVDVLDVLCII